MDGKLNDKDNIKFKYAKGPKGIMNEVFHEDYEFFFLIDGEVELIHEYRRKKLKPYEFVYIPPGKYHQFLITGDVKKYERVVFMFPHKTLFGKEKNTLNEIFTIEKNEFIKSAVFKSIDYNERLPEDFFCDILKSVINEIYTLIACYNNLPQEDAENVLDFVTEYINNNIEKKLTVEDIASNCFLSPSTLSHKFKSKYGISLMKYVERKKMLVARQYLKEKYMPIEVCNMLGYNEYSTFYRAYQKHFGTGPSRF